MVKFVIKRKDKSIVTKDLKKKMMAVVKLKHHVSLILHFVKMIHNVIF